MLNDPLIQIIINKPSLYNLQEIIDIRKLNNGVVHHVWRLETKKGFFFLKKREKHFAKIPQIETCPQNIKYEYKATNVLYKLLPDQFPKPIFFDINDAILITSDVIPNGEDLESIFLNNKATLEIIKNIGKTLRKIHDTCRSLNLSIRENDDQSFYFEKLSHKINSAHHPVLKPVLEDLYNNKPKQIIIGDLSPKNIGINNNGDRITFFDLEDVHKGDPIFDISFIIGHLILHFFNNEKLAKSFIDCFFESYGKPDLDQNLISALSLGTLLYRLHSVVPYCISFNDKEKAKITEKIYSLLSNYNQGKLHLRYIVENLFKE